jgi:hypothetical protein
LDVQGAVNEAAPGLGVRRANQISKSVQRLRWTRRGGPEIHRGVGEALYIAQIFLNRFSDITHL